MICTICPSYYNCKIGSPGCKLSACYERYFFPDEILKTLSRLSRDAYETDTRQIRDDEDDSRITT